MSVFKRIRDHLADFLESSSTVVVLSLSELKSAGSISTSEYTLFGFADEREKLTMLLILSQL